MTRELVGAELGGEQRAHRYQLATRILERFARDDRALADRAHAAQPDGWPHGGDGAHSTDVSDPTGQTVVARESGSRDHALDALDKVMRAIDALIAADSKRATALPPVEPEDVDGDCTNCLRVSQHNPRNTNPKDFAQPCPRCTWCAGFWREHKFDAPEWILLKRREGRRITTADVTRAVLEQRRTRKRKRR